MEKKLIIFLCALLIGVNLKAQTLQDAIRLTDNEQYEAATAAFQALISKEPGNAINYYYLGENYLLSDNPDSAELMYNQGAKADPNNLLLPIGHAKRLLNLYSIAETKRNSNIANDDLQKVKSNYDKLAVKSSEDETHLNEMKAKV